MVAQRAHTIADVFMIYILDAPVASLVYSDNQLTPMWKTYGAIDCPFIEGLLSL